MRRGRPGSRYRRVKGFTLFEMVVVICAIVILYMVAERRLNEIPAAAERASFFAVLSELQTGIKLKMFSGLARGGVREVSNLSGQNPMDFMLETPANYEGELEQVTDRNATRASWYYETASGELVYVVGGASIEDVFVTIGGIDVNLGQIRLRVENVYSDDAGDLRINLRRLPLEQRGKWEGLLLRPVRPFVWRRRPAEPVNISREAASAAET